MDSTINYWGFVIGIIGLVLAVYSLIVQIRGTKKKKPVYNISSISLIEEFRSKLEYSKFEQQIKFEKLFLKRVETLKTLQKKFRHFYERI